MSAGGVKDARVPPAGEGAKSLSMRPFLECLRDDLPPAIIDGGGYDRIAAVVSEMPGDLSTFWGFETRLGEGSALADVLFSVVRGSAGQGRLADMARARAGVPGSGAATWARLGEFAKHWLDAGHPFHRAVKNLWLEYDTSEGPLHNGPSDPAGNPSLFLGPDCGALPGDVLSETLAEALGALAGGESSPAVRTLAGSLPEGAQLFQAGLMLSRPAAGLRLCVKGLPDGEVVPWLEGTGWRGGAASLARLIDALGQLTDELAVDLDMGPGGPGEKIGIECYLDRTGSDLRRWEDFLGSEEIGRLVLPRKREGLLSYPGVSAMPGSLAWPGGGVFRHNIERKIHHVKLNFRGEALIEAKAYLLVTWPAADTNNPGGWVS